MKILIIEDSVRLRKSLCSGFAGLGFTVDSAGDGKEGLSFALSFAYDVIVLDIMLPAMDGFAILKEVRNKRVDTNIIILSAKDQIEDRVRGLNLGADDYLCKPFSFDELYARVLTLIRRSHQLKTNTISIGTVQVNLALRRVLVKEKELKCTPIEYVLLEQLILNLDRILSIEQLLSHLSDSNCATTKNSIEVHISAIRKKLALLGIFDLIETKRGFGYVVKKP